jgi:predicted CoA-substrate-specific enzyme activase
VRKLSKQVSLGIDVGSVTTKVIFVDENDEIIEGLYIRTKGNPIDTIKYGMIEAHNAITAKFGDIEVVAVGTTGSGRQLAGIVVGADLVKNEISAHAYAAIHEVPDVSTIFEIGGQDSKIIFIRNGAVTDFAMNTVCAAGTGSFLDHQAERIGIDIEKFGDYSIRASNPVRIAGRCTVFAESDMIHKQQMGATSEDIIAGLSESLVRNYLNNLARGKELLPQFVFQGGVSENIGIVKAFEEIIGSKVIVPKNNKLMGAWGVAMLAKRELSITGHKTNFKGFKITEVEHKTRVFYCDGCANNCEVYEVIENGETIAYWGDRCGKWSNKITSKVRKADRSERRSPEGGTPLKMKSDN